jgi:RND family efflux transporter MFP subunit
MFTIGTMHTKRASFLLLLAPLAAACTDAHSSHPPPNEVPVPVRVVAVERASLSTPLRAIGRLGHKRSLTLAFKNGGTVRTLFVQEGALVKKGQHLALVDRTEIDAQVAQAQAAVDKADRDKRLLDRLHAGAAAAQNDADNATTAANIAHATLETLLYNQNATVLTAPEDGRIDKRLVEVGEVVGPGRPIFAMSGTSAGIVARVGVIDRDRVGLKLGDTAIVEVDALPGRHLSAQVSEVAAVPSPSGTYEVELRLAPSDAPLVAGMTAKVTVDRPAGPPQPVVPLTALLDADGMRAALYALAPLGTGQTVRRVEVGLARFAGDRVAIASGLKGDERIVSEGASFVEPGRMVRAISAESVQRELGSVDAHR